MILITGGAYAGKGEYAREHFTGKKIIPDVHKMVREWLTEGRNPTSEIERLINEYPDAVFITDEVGSGIVPIDKAEREWREAVGRVSCLIAMRADCVIRVVCGIGIKLK